MTCFSHPDSEAVASCVSCGRGVCESCASVTSSGRIVCSRRCEERLTERLTCVLGWALIVLAGLSVALSVYIFQRPAPYLGVVVLLHGVGALAVGAVLLSVPESEEIDSWAPFYGHRAEIRWRAGLALRQAHRFRARLAAFLSEYAGLSGESLTVSQLACADEARRQELVGRVCRGYHALMADVADPRPIAVDKLCRSIGVMHSLGWSALADYTERGGLSFGEREELVKDLITMARRMDVAAMDLLLCSTGLERKQKSVEAGDSDPAEH